MTDLPIPERVIKAIGTVRSDLTDLGDAPRQGDEGAPSARIEIRPEYRAALDGIAVGDRLVVLTWLHRADRTILTTRPRDDPQRAPVGVFATRSPDRPNPIGLHETTVVDIDDSTVTVDALDAIDATPVLDIKPVLGPPGTR